MPPLDPAYVMKTTYSVEHSPLTSVYSVWAVDATTVPKTDGAALNASVGGVTFGGYGANWKPRALASAALPDSSKSSGFTYNFPGGPVGRRVPY